MTLPWIFLSALVLIGLGIFVLSRPVSIAFESQEPQLKFHWLGIDYRYFFWRTGQNSALYLFGMQIPLRKKESRKQKAPRPSSRQRKEPLERFGRFLWRCARDSEIRGRVLAQLRRLAGQFRQGIEVYHFHSELSLPDPATTGMLAGLAAGAGWGFPSPFGLNFMGNNNVEIEIRLHPDRFAWALGSFLLRIPHRSVYRQWRTSKRERTKR
ncbi:MAG: hypothetical protein HY313_08990 [Acidobacteria bacterium]|nr:hypothetical protein [Acidobacteriota bacterium]